MSTYTMIEYQGYAEAPYVEKTYNADDDSLIDVRPIVFDEN